MSISDFDIDALIRTYGYFAIVLGTVFEGEATMLAAGVAARGELLSVEWVLAAGMLGTFISDMFCFCAGRWGGPRLTQWFPKTMARIDDGMRMIERHHDKLIVFHQFVPGMCTITPLAFGMSEIRVARFMVLNIIGNFLWTATYLLLGYGAAIAWLRLSRSTPSWVMVVGVVIVVALAIHWIIRRKTNRARSIE
jgi:membrane protein DedA with SNARE-associated domain